MSSFSEQQIDKQEAKRRTFEMEKMRREKKAGLYYYLAKLFCGGLVIGTLVSYFNGNMDDGKMTFIIILGIFLTVSFIVLGNNKLKNT